jgi:hypothetical protein
MIAGQPLFQIVWIRFTSVVEPVHDLTLNHEGTNGIPDLRSGMSELSCMTRGGSPTVYVSEPRRNKATGATILGCLAIQSRKACSCTGG